MLRKLLAAVLVLALTAPTVVQARSACGMDAPVLGAAACDCCDSPATTNAAPCGSRAAADGGCGCSIQRESSHSEPVVPATVQATDAPVADIALLPADLSTPQRVPRTPLFAAPPPRTAASRPQLCIWTI